MITTNWTTIIVTIKIRWTVFIKKFIFIHLEIKTDLQSDNVQLDRNVYSLYQLINIIIKS